MLSIVGQKFHNAINQDNLDQLKNLLSQYSPDTKLEMGFTPLMLCCSEEKLELVRCLLEAGANINITSQNGTTALKVAVLKDDSEMVELLLEYGANPNLKDLSGHTPLMYAVKDGQEKIVSLLIKNGGDPYIESENGKNNAIAFAQLMNHKNVEEVLTKSGQNKVKREDLIGQNQAKNQLDEIISLYKLNRERIKNNLPDIDITFHSVYIGNPGTGKTTFARFFAEEVKNLGLLKKGHLVEVTRNDLVAKYNGQTAEKTQTVFESALDGILFIDEAYSLKTDKDDQFGQECINTLITLIENHRDRIIVVLAGYREEMLEFLHHNTGLKSRIPNLIEFEDFSNDELKQIMQKMLDKKELITNEKNLQFAIKEISKKRKERSFGNAREVRNAVERSIIQQCLRLAKENKESYDIEELKNLIFSDFTKDPQDKGSYEELFPSFGDHKDPLEELSKLVGLQKIKTEIKDLSDFVKVSKMRNPGKLPDIGLHMIFTGNPGTGKTTVARLLGSLFKDLDLLSSGHVVEVDRSGLVAPYVGQTALKTKEAVEKSLGGILFIDEAYALYRGSGGNDFGLEAIDTLLKYMEDFRGRFVVVLAGYTKEMDQFLQSNSGLKSRFNRIMEFPNFSAEELIKILEFMVTGKGYKLAKDLPKDLAPKIEEMMRQSNFGNAREMRNLAEQSYKQHASRLIELQKEKKLSQDELNTLTKEDFLI